MSGGGDEELFRALATVRSGTERISGPIADALEVVMTAAKRHLLQNGADLLAYAQAQEQWEADLILDQKAWNNGAAALPTLTYPLWDRLLELQGMRNAAIALAHPAPSTERT